MTDKLLHPELGSGALREAWRIGSKVPLNIYDGDRPVCQCHTVADAQLIVKAVNALLSLSSPIEPSEQITKLANFIMAEIDGEPSQSEGAVDCAIRLLSAMNQRIQILERKAQASSEIRERVEHLPRYIFTPNTEACCKQVPNGGWLVLEDVLEALAPSRQGAGGK